MDTFRYASATEVVFGAGSAARVGDEAVRLGGSRTLLVTDAGLASAGVADPIEAYLRGTDALSFCGTWDQVPQDPSFADVEALVQHVRDERVDVIVSLGSGSVLAAGRSAGVCAPTSMTVREVVKQGADNLTPLLNICLPTTAGSGGEVSRQATLSDNETGEKSGVRGWAAAARLAILDPDLLVSVPASQAVASGIDAMTHALEAYWSRRASPVTDALARPSFKVLFTELIPSIETRDREVLGRMLVASTMANLACGSAGLGLVHGLNKGVTGVSHQKGYQTPSYGMLHGVLLPWVVDFNRAQAARPLADLAADIGVHDPSDPVDLGARRLLETLVEWLDQLQAPTALDWPDCADEDIQAVADDTGGRPMWKDNPRQATIEELKELTRRSLVSWTDSDWSVE